MENQASPVSPQPELAELQRQFNSLHSVVVSLMVLMIIITAILGFFLMNQAKLAQTDQRVVQMGYTNAVAQYERIQPAIEQAVKKFKDFARTNADFVPILAKYIDLQPGAASAPPAPVAGKK